MACEDVATMMPNRMARHKELDLIILTIMLLSLPTAGLLSNIHCHSRTPNVQLEYLKPALMPSHCKTPYSGRTLPCLKTYGSLRLCTRQAESGRSTLFDHPYLIVALEGSTTI